MPAISPSYGWPELFGAVVVVMFLFDQVVITRRTRKSDRWTAWDRWDMWVYSPLFVALCLAAGASTFASRTSALSQVLGLLWIGLGLWYGRRAFVFHRARLEAQRRGEPPPTLR